ncbi:MAG: hypothetical protein AB7S63_01505 [Thauera sp.]
MQESSQAVVLATGALPTLILVAAILTLPVCLALLGLYRRAVLRSMARTSPDAASAAAAAPDATPAAVTPPAAPLRFETLASAAAASGGSSPLRAAIRRSLQAASLIHVIAGLVYALVLTGAWMRFSWDDGGFVLARFLWLLSCYAWPTALTVGLVVATTTRQRVAVGLAYALMLFAFAGWGLVRNPSLSALDIARFWAITNLPATVLLLAFLHRRIRAVGPLVLAFMVVAAIGAQVAISLAGQNETTLLSVIEVGSVLGLGGVQIFWGLMLAGAALAGLVGWQALKWLGRRHLARRSSDQTLTLEAMWLLFAVVQTVSFAFEGLAWMAAGPVAFAAWKLVTSAGFRLAGLGQAPTSFMAPSGSAGAGRAAAPALLLLRVFALGARSERLFDALGKRWLRIGNIDMIAGPDLATTAVEPHEFLDFVGGRLSRQFVRDDADLARRFAARALGPDPDGRHRVNEFFCHDDTWRPTMLRLAQAADVVLMDLRGFTPQNQGCRYELQQLLDFVTLERVVVLIDARTSRDFIESTLQKLWRTSRADSPNRSRSPARVRLLEDRGGATITRLVEALLEALGQPRSAHG